ncbi:MAG: hypothetical protein PHX83_08330 [Acidobacteriia bacterium]|nr:hypothetical protein [Terriglobia bacterium]
MTNMQERAEKQEPGKYEPTDASEGSVVRFGIGLAVVIVLCLFAMRWVMLYLGDHKPVYGPPVSAMASYREIPAAPRLEITETRDFQEFRATEDATLNSYGWVDRTHGVVRIPIDRAMSLLAARGLPARTTAAPSGRSETRGK